MYKTGTGVFPDQWDMLNKEVDKIKIPIKCSKGFRWILFGYLLTEIGFVIGMIVMLS